MNKIDAFMGPIAQDWISQMTEREEGIMQLLLEIVSLSRAETYCTGNTNDFLKNVKSAIKKYKLKGPTITFQPTWNEVLRTIKKLERIGMMKIDEDGLPEWLYRNWKKIEDMIEGRA